MKNHFFNVIIKGRSTSITLDIDKMDFIEQLTGLISYNEESIIFTKTERIYSGKIISGGFKLFENQSLILSSNSSIIQGSFQETNKGLQINILTRLFETREKIFIAFGTFLLLYSLVFFFSSTPKFNPFMGIVVSLIILAFSFYYIHLDTKKALLKFMSIIQAFR